MVEFEPLGPDCSDRHVRSETLLRLLAGVGHLVPRGGGGVRLLWRFLSPPGRCARVTWHGFKMWLDFSAGGDSLPYFTGLHERPTARLLSKLLGPGALFIDAGANAGYFSLLALGRVGPEGKVIAFEPAPDVAELLAENFALNRARNAELRQVALSDVPGRVTMAHVPLSSVSTLLVGPADRVSGFAATQTHLVITVQSSTLDKECLGLVRSWPKRKVMKMDIEGVEPRALAGARETLKYLDAVVIEIEPELLKAHEFSPSDVTDALQNAGFRGYAIPARRGLIRPIGKENAATRNYLFARPGLPESVGVVWT